MAAVTVPSSLDCVARELLAHGRRRGGSARTQSANLARQVMRGGAGYVQGLSRTDTIGRAGRACGDGFDVLKHLELLDTHF